MAFCIFQPDYFPVISSPEIYSCVFFPNSSSSVLIVPPALHVLCFVLYVACRLILFACKSSCACQLIILNENDDDDK